MIPREIPADSMPEDAWEQRQKLKEIILDAVEFCKRTEKYPGLALNALRTATLVFLALETEYVEDFIYLTGQYVHTLYKDMHYFAEGLEKSSKQHQEEDE